MKPIAALVVLVALVAAAGTAHAGEFSRFSTPDENIRAAIPTTTHGRYPIPSGHGEYVPVGAYLPKPANSAANVRHYAVGEASVDTYRKVRSRDAKGRARYDRRRAAWSR
ncbi:hypothetical protein [Bosea sp. RAC05]|uniref:hypothetical protein n=1 Tax=Bosea sp. RAC05 TaxID=1842539 RepID=UPI00083D6518|nr:hypothetical protein [Bosea sp. RAC05]AOG03073.1 hypothetical protein BSY19_5038 [Bosea sp. RAC05]